MEIMDLIEYYINSDYTIVDSSNDEFTIIYDSLKQDNIYDLELDDYKLLTIEAFNNQVVLYVEKEEEEEEF